MPRPAREEPPRVASASAPEGWADWPDDRVSCASCGRRQGHRCESRGFAHLAELRHRCEDYRRG